MVIGGYSRGRVHDHGCGHGDVLRHGSVPSHVNANASGRVHGYVLRGRVQRVHGDQNMPYRPN